MNLTGLTQILRESDTYQSVLTRLSTHKSLSLNIIRSARTYLLGTLAQDWQGPIVVITPHIKRAYNISEQLPVWLEKNDDIHNFTEPTAQFYERVTWIESAIHNRIQALNALMPLDVADEQRPIVISSARSLMQRTIPVNQFRRESLVLEVGQRHQTNKLIAQWVGLGYEATPIVIQQGTFSRRGGVLDIFPLGTESPIRLDFFDDEIDTLREFNPETQRSDTRLKRVAIPPARETLPKFTPPIAQHLKSWFDSLPPAQDDMTTPISDNNSLETSIAFPFLEQYLPYMYPHPVSLLDYAPGDALIVIEDQDRLRDTIETIEDQAEALKEELIVNKSIPNDLPKPYLSWQDIQVSLEGHHILHLGYGNEIDTDIDDLSFTPGGRFGGQLRTMLTDVKQKQAQGGRIIVVTEQASRLTNILHEQESLDFVPINNDIIIPPEKSSLTFINGTLNEGWGLSLDHSETHLFTDAEIFGWNRPEPRRRKTVKRVKTPESNYADWKEGDYVVHVDYGIGKFSGVMHRKESDLIVIQYGGNDTLYVPIHQTDRLTKYIGADGSAPKLHRIGKPEWTRVRTRVKKAVEEEARDLLALYATRAKAKGHAFSPDSHWQHELEASFPYVETEDQLRSVMEIKTDMESSMPMDRLICGDVGYGKTEVALRATFKAVMDGKQVTILVPTTVLAQQHYDTFTNRLAPFPIKVELMSRFRSNEHQSRILPKIASGEVDVIIGTHRILSKDITINNLGLVIIDEEQRFGVKQKEHFKKLRTQVDVLTLTATPIPRTLYMSLAGVRDISMIQTPPEERLPVITHFGRFDEKLIQQAILREIERGGQIFVVHNRIRTIETLHEKLKEIVPEARIVVGHGQMSGHTLETVMSQFAHGEYDVLLSTAIIESGIDIPNANTLIVDRADWFGMAQLYQLRGRVGRGAQQAYAYFFHPRKHTEESQLRLETLAENTHLGAGFQIAMRDLEIRGAGDILSTKQTGHVAAIGLNLYTQLLSQEIKKLRGDENEYSPSNTTGIIINIPLPAYIPDTWIPEMAIRLQIYRRIAALTTTEQVDTMLSELQDRFGKLPLAVKGLLYQIKVKLLAQMANATQIAVKNNQIEIRLPYLGSINRAAFEQKLGDDVTVSRTAITLPHHEEKHIWQQQLLDILERLADGIQEGVGI